MWLLHTASSSLLYDSNEHWLGTVTREVYDLHLRSCEQRIWRRVAFGVPYLQTKKRRWAICNRYPWCGGCLPPVDLRAVCLVRAIDIGYLRRRSLSRSGAGWWWWSKGKVKRSACQWCPAFIQISRRVNAMLPNFNSRINVPWTRRVVHVTQQR